MSYYLFMIGAAFCFIGFRHLEKSVIPLAWLMPLLCSGFCWILTWPIYLEHYFIVAVAKQTINWIVENHTSVFDTGPTEYETGGSGNAHFCLYVIILFQVVINMVQWWFKTKCGCNVMGTMATQPAFPITLCLIHQQLPPLHPDQNR